MRITTIISLAVPALLVASAALAHDGPHDDEGLPIWLWLAFSAAGSAAAFLGYRALYRAARARDAAATEEDGE